MLSAIISSFMRTAAFGNTSKPVFIYFAVLRFALLKNKTSKAPRFLSHIFCIVKMMVYHCY